MNAFHHHEDALNEIASHAPGVMYQMRIYPDGRFCFPYTSTTVKSVFGLNPEDISTDGTPLASTIHPDDSARVWEAVFKSRDNLVECVCEFRVIVPGQETKWVMGHSRPQKLDDGSVLWNGVFTNISQRIKIESELRKATRLNAVMAQINQMVIHAENEQEVYSEACRIAVDVGEFKMAWIGLIDPAHDILKPISWKGYEEGYLSDVKISTKEDTPEGKGPSGRSFRENKTVVCNNIDEDDSYLSFRESASKRSYKSSIALPIKIKDKLLGTFNLYADSTNFFNQSEVSLLEDLTRNISFVISAIASNKEFQKTQEELVKSEQKFRTIFEKAPLGVAMIDSLNGEFLSVNAKYLEILGRSVSEVKDWMSLTHPEDVQDDLDNMALLNQKKIPGFKMIKRYILPDQSIRWVEMSVVPLPEDGNPTHLCMVEDISQRKETEDKIKKNEEDLRSALSLRDEFISIASHELRTPLTSLKLQLQMLMRQNQTPDLMKALTLSSKQVNRMMKLIENLLDVARIQSGKFLLKFESLNLSEAINDAIERFEDLFREAHCELRVEIEPEVIGQWDRNRIDQVFSNLFSNAIKYAPGNPVFISLLKRKGFIDIIVQDHGPGISREKHSVIFDRFERDTNINNVSGIGLGLFIVKQIVEAHHGQIIVESDVGKGARFIVKLPLNL